MASNRRNREGGKSVQDFAPQILTQTKTEPNRFKENGRAKIDAFAATRQANRRRVVSLPMKPQEKKNPLRLQTVGKPNRKGNTRALS